MPLTLRSIFEFAFAKPDTDWTFHMGRMRRRVDGAWQYRDMTEEEQDRWVKDDAW